MLDLHAFIPDFHTRFGFVRELRFQGSLEVRLLRTGNILVNTYSKET